MKPYEIKIVEMIAYPPQHHASCIVYINVEISGSHSGKYEDDRLLGYGIV
jgi:hypothetical protein